MVLIDYIDYNDFPEWIGRSSRRQIAHIFPYYLGIYHLWEMTHQIKFLLN